MIPNIELPTHPGEILWYEFLKPMGITQLEFSSRLGIPIQRLNGVIKGRRSISAESAWLLAKELKTSAEFWMSLQAVYDLYHAKRRMKLAA
jgi:addiction module HigA family antidote